MALLRKDKPQIFTPSALTASAFEVSKGNGLETLQNLTVIQQPWQAQSWVYYDLVPEVRFAATFIGNALARVRMYAAKMPSHTHERPEEQQDGPAFLAVASLKDRFSGQRGLLRDLALNLTIPGEGYLVGTTVNGKPSWQVCSRDEIKFTGDDNQPAYIKDYPGATPKPIGKDDLVIRVWRSHPRFSALADSAMQGVLDDCEKLLLLSKAEKSSLRSRNAGAGILFIPIELVPPSQQTQSHTANPIQSNPLYTQLAESMMAPIHDESHPSALIPTMIFGQADYGDKIRHILLTRPFDQQATAIRESAIKRIAVAFDLPTDYLLGLTDVSHWTAWSIKDDAFSAHLQPFIEMICDALSAHYLQPALQRAGVKDWDQYVVWYDATDLVARPDKKEAAEQAYDRGTINAETLRRVLGFTESDKMTDEEYAKFVGLKLADAHLALTGQVPPDVKSTQDKVATAQIDMAKARQDVASKQLDIAQQQAGSAPSGGGGAGRPNGSVTGYHPPRSTVGGPNAGIRKSTEGRRVQPGQLPDRNALRASAYVGTLSEQLADIDSDLITGTTTLLEGALKASMGAAATEIRTLVAQNHVMRASVAGISDSELSLFLGPNAVARLGFTEYQNIVGMFSEYSDQAGVLFQGALDDGLFLLQNHFGGDVPITFLADVAAAQFQSTLKALIQRYLFEQDLPKTESLVKDVRSMIDTVNGVTVFVPEVSGIATGPIVRDFLASVGAGGNENIWLYRTDIPRPTERLNAHLQLDGFTFTDWADEGLRVPDEATYRFLKREFMAPGDHYGCRCVVAPWLPSE